MSRAFLPLPRWVRDKANRYLAGMAARGFVPPPMDEVAAMASAPPLPDGVWERQGELVYQCRSCGETVRLEFDPEEFDPETAYCGGSPRCLP